MNKSLTEKIKALRQYFVMCRFFGHKWRYNFPISSIPNKAICEKCYAKSKLNLRTLDWEVVADFENEKRTDKELAGKWF
jgi:hypothetical protein